jgi:hypothetical protein
MGCFDLCDDDGMDEDVKTEPNWDQALDRVVNHLSAMAKDRFLRFGPDDVRGAALWDASCWIDERLMPQIRMEASGE